MATIKMAKRLGEWRIKQIGLRYERRRRKAGDATYIAKALGVVARAKGMANIAAETGLSREQLYRSFSEKGNPTLKTTLAVMKALGIGLTVKV